MFNKLFIKAETQTMSARRFLYQAHGVVLGGTITQPFQADLEGQPATSLPSIGGFASAKTEKYSLKDIISYKSAHTYTSGTRTHDGIHHTSVTSVVEGLNILHVITADAIIGRLSAKHRESGEPDIIPLGSVFDNLRIAGQPVHVDLDHDRFAQNPTLKALAEDYESKSSKSASRSKDAQKIRYQWGLPSDEIPSSLEQGMLLPPGVACRKSNGMLHTSMVKAVRPVGPGYSAEERPYGYAIHIPHVGNLYLAEISVSGDSKRLCMLRLELGCPVVGSFTAADVKANGIWP